MTFATRQEVADKVNWEGDLEAALDYGLRVDDMPENDAELREAWARLAEKWNAYRRVAESVERLLGLDD